MAMTGGWCFLAGIWPMALLKTHFWMNLRGDLWVTFQSSMSPFGLLKKNDGHSNACSEWEWWSLPSVMVKSVSSKLADRRFLRTLLFNKRTFWIVWDPRCYRGAGQWISRRSDTTAVNRGACFKVLPESMKEPIPIYPNPLETCFLMFIMFRHVSPWFLGQHADSRSRRANPIPVQSSAEPFISASGTCPGG